MSMESVALDMSYAAVRQRLFNPPGGQRSTELEIVTEPVLRRQRLDALTERARLMKQAKLDAQVARYEDLKLAYATMLARRNAAVLDQRVAVVLSAELYVAPPIVEPLPPRAPYIQQIVAEVCRRYNVTPVDVRSQRRKVSIVRPRQIIMYIARTMTELSFPQIGRQLGNRDHTTVLHAVNKMTCLVDNNPQFAAEITEIMASIAARQQ